MEKAKRFSQGSVDTTYAFSSFFIDNSAHIHCAARVVDLNSLAQFIILYSLRHSQQNSMRTKKHGKQQLSLACEEPAQQTETTALSMQVNLPHRLHLPVMYPPLQSILRHLLPFPRPCSSSTKGLFVGPPGTGRISFSQSQLVLSVVHPHVSLLVVSMMKPNYVVTEVSGASLVVQALRKASCSGPVIRQN